MSKTLDQMTQNNWAWGGTSGYARYEFSDDFVDEDGRQFEGGSKSYLEVPTTIVGSIVTIPAYPDFPTTEAAILNNGVTVTCHLLDSNRIKRTTLFEDCRIYTSLPSVISLSQLVLANGASRLLRDTDVWTKEQVIDYINTLPPAVRMTALVYGSGRLRVPASDPTDPELIGSNDPLLYGSGDYEGYINAQQGDGTVRIFRTLSRDAGRTWELADPAYFIAGGAGETQVHAPHVVDVAGVRYLFAGVYTTAYKVVLWKSYDGGRTFDRYGTVVDVGTAGAFDDAGVSFPKVYYDADEANAAKRWKMLYAGTATSGASDEKIGYAHAPAAEGPWTKYASNPWLSPVVGTWENNGLVPSAIVKDGTTFHFFYAGRSAAGASGYYTTGLVTFTDFEGTKTRSASNPVLNRRSSASQDLTANLNAGSRTATMASTAVFNTNEYVLVDDADSVPRLNRIKSIDSPTQITLRDAVIDNYTTAQTARIRSIYYGGVHISAIWRESGTWVAAFTAFLTYQDASHLVEVTAFATASSLTGAWTISDERGVAVELKVNSMYEVSAENMAVIEARRPIAGTSQMVAGKVYSDTSRSIASGASYSAIEFSRINSVSIGVSWSAADPTKLTILNDGWARVGAEGFFSAAAGQGDMYIGLTRNAVESIISNATPSNSTLGTIMAANGMEYFLAGDYLRLMVRQNSGGALDFSGNNVNSPVLTIGGIR